jgi:XTP/dITP diphosphohydrolase
MTLYFVSQNNFKADEVAEYLKPHRIHVVRVERTIQEILDIDVEKIARHKVLEAFKKVGHPCAVEHGALVILSLNGLPSGLSKPVWDAAGDKLCSYLGEADRTAIAKSVVAYCDGRKISLFTGETTGQLATESRGDYKFQWDPAFIPDGQSQTFGEMGFPAKAKYSQAKKAWDLFASHLKSTM